MDKEGFIYAKGKSSGRYMSMYDLFYGKPISMKNITEATKRIRRYNREEISEFWFLPKEHLNNLVRNELDTGKYLEKYGFQVSE